MKNPTLFLLLSILMALAITLSATSSGQSLTNHHQNANTSGETEEQLSVSFRRTGTNSHFLKKKSRGVMKCNKYPRICKVRGSPGPDCCHKKCVNVKKDNLNCGLCGKKCKYSEICCRGKCVNRLSDKNNCGGCNNRCKKGSYCVFGMCSYAD